MKVKKSVEVDLSTAYAGWSGLEITDVDGTEVTIKMTKDEWLDLEAEVKSKCDGIRKERQEKLDEIVEQRIAAELEFQESEVE